MYDRFRELASRIGKRYRSKSRRPTVSFDLDGTLANTFQEFLNIAAEHDPSHIYTVDDLRCTGCCVDPSSPACKATVCVNSDSSLRRVADHMEAAKRAAFETPYFWSNIEPFDRDELALIRDQIAGERYVPVFIATRDDLDTPADCADARILSHRWLENHSITGYMSVFDSVDKVHDLLMHGSEYHIDDDPDDVQRLREAGIEAFLVSRPWNLHVRCDWRVDSVAQFLDVVAPCEFGQSEMLNELSYLARSM